jgi:anti-sigma regulatory factor (Ser/Thr protein kinase)
LFLNTNWAHHLDPASFPLNERDWEIHLPVIQFRDGDEQFRAVSRFLDVIMSSLRLQRSHIASLEWAINEVTDNVLNHSGSRVGGFVQVTTLHDRVSFCVADSGSGVLRPLSCRYAHLRGDAEAILLSVEPGVTRDPASGRGNGLTGSLRIATASGGSFRMMSGGAEAIWNAAIPSTTRTMTACYFGTVVDVQVRTDMLLDLRAVLAGLSPDPNYAPTDLVETHYVAESGSELVIRVVEEGRGLGTRQAGALLRTKCMNLLAAEPTLPLVLDWDCVGMITSSFADEFVAKMRVSLGADQFETRIRMRNTPSIVADIIRVALAQRGSVSDGEAE